MKKLEHFIEAIILASRWLLVVFYLGLTAALLLYAISFGGKLYEFVTKLFTLAETDTILKMLSLIDAALVASLVVMSSSRATRTSSAASTMPKAPRFHGWARSMPPR